MVNNEMAIDSGVKEVAGGNWVDERLAALQVDSRWQPDAARALSQLRRRLGAKVSRSWAWNPGWTIVALAVTVAVVFVLLAAPAPRVLAQRCVDCSVALWQSISSTSRVQAELTPEGSRRLATDFVLEDAGGKPVRLSAYKGRVVLLNFWATWCGGCKTEMPWFVELQKEFGEGGLNAIGVSLDEDGYKSVTPYLREHPVNYAIVVGPQELGEQYGVEAMPVTLLIDRSGKIAAKHVGLVTKAQYQLEIAALLSEKTSDKAANALLPRRHRTRSS
jgi:thiol-disulfide isomerase/thioredoxin